MKKKKNKGNFYKKGDLLVIKKIAYDHNDSLRIYYHHMVVIKGWVNDFVS